MIYNKNKRYKNWIIIFLLGSCLLCFQSCFDKHKPKKITYQKFENEIINRNDIQKINVVNEKLVEVYINTKQLNSTQERYTLGASPQYYFYIDKDIESFLKKTKKLNKKNIEAIELVITFEYRENVIQKTKPLILPSLIILICTFYIIIWIYTLIKIARTAYKNPYYSLIWILIIIFVPIIGLLLYLIINKTKNMP